MSRLLAFSGFSAPSVVETRHKIQASEWNNPTQVERFDLGNCTKK